MVLEKNLASVLNLLKLCTKLSDIYPAGKCNALLVCFRLLRNKSVNCQCPCTFSNISVHSPDIACIEMLLKGKGS